MNDTKNMNHKNVCDMKRGTSFRMCLGWFKCMGTDSYLSASLYAFVASAPLLRDFSKEPMNYLNFYANTDTSKSTCNHKHKQSFPNPMP